VRECISGEKPESVREELLGSWWERSASSSTEERRGAPPQILHGKFVESSWENS
jgi:hypothetical protein